jgi:hypothetical protein
LIILLVRQSITVERYPELHFFLLGALFSFLFALLLFVKLKRAPYDGYKRIDGICFGLSVHSQNIFAITFLTIMNGFVASSRLVMMKAHTSKELIIGLWQHSTNAIIVLVAIIHKK